MTGRVGPPWLAINGRFLTQRMTGVQRFAIETVKAIDALLAGPPYHGLAGRIELLTPHGARALPLDRVGTRPCGRLGGYAWEQLELPCFSAGRLLLNLCALGPAITRRQVVVVHDATVRAMPEAFSPVFRAAYGVLIPLLCRRARLVVTVSEFSRREIARSYGARADAMVVCGEGSDHITAVPPDPAFLERHGLAGRRFLLAVGVGSRNKNVETVLRAFAAARLGETLLVLTGKRDARVHGDPGIPASASVRHVGYVGDAELRALYEHALALVYPSRYEGFGLPPVEAMACGCPVVISRQPALREIAGDAALSCEAEDAEALAVLMRRVATDDGLREALAQRGRARAASFLWRRTAATLLDRCLALAPP